MGYHISICPVERINGKIKIEEPIDDLYMSYNFNDLNSICLQHPFEDNCEHHGNDCILTHIWYFDDDCHGRSGSNISSAAQNALSLLETIDVYPSTPKFYDCSWELGLGQNRKERLSTFAYHINNIRKLAQDHPDWFFFGDTLSAEDDVIMD